MRKVKLTILLLVSTSFGCLYSQDSPSSKLTVDNPNKIRFATDDVTRFWQLADALPAATNRDDTIKLIHQLYLDKASSGFKEYLDVEANENQKDVTQAYLDLLRHYPAFLQSIRNSSQQIHTYRLATVAALTKLKQLDSSVHFTDVTFAIGFVNTGGAASQLG